MLPWQPRTSRATPVPCPQPQRPEPCPFPAGPQPPFPSEAGRRLSRDEQNQRIWSPRPDARPYGPAGVMLVGDPGACAILPESSSCRTAHADAASKGVSATGSTVGSGGAGVQTQLVGEGPTSCRQSRPSQVPAGLALSCPETLGESTLEAEPCAYTTDPPHNQPREDAGPVSQARRPRPGGSLCGNM